MSEHTIRNLSTLVRLRSDELERMQGELAAQGALRERYRTSLERLSNLCESSGPSGALPLALAANCGDYKQAMLALAATHRLDLDLHEANMALAQRAVNAAWAKREALDLVLTHKKNSAAGAQQRRDGKRNDELATQVWLRGQVK